MIINSLFEILAHIILECWLVHSIWKKRVLFLHYSDLLSGFLEIYVYHCWSCKWRWSSIKRLIVCIQCQRNKYWNNFIFYFQSSPPPRFSWGIVFFFFLNDGLGCLRVFFTLSFATQGPFFPGGPIRVLFFLFLLLLLLWSFSPFSLLDNICFLKAENISI